MESPVGPNERIAILEQERDYWKAKAQERPPVPDKEAIQRAVDDIDRHVGGFLNAQRRNAIRGVLRALVRRG